MTEAEDLFITTVGGGGTHLSIQSGPTYQSPHHKCDHLVRKRTFYVLSNGNGEVLTRHRHKMTFICLLEEKNDKAIVIKCTAEEF